MQAGTRLMYFLNSNSIAPPGPQAMLIWRFDGNSYYHIHSPKRIWNPGSGKVGVNYSKTGYVTVL